MLQHTLIVGTTGAGKSYTERLILDRLVADKLSTFVLVDPKRVELADYAEGMNKRSKCMAHAEDPSETYDAITSVYTQMMMRFDAMKRGKVREWEYGPLYLFVDEMGAIMNDHRHRKMYAEMIGNITMMGRAARVFCVLATQVPTRENIPNSIRDNMTNKVCLRLDNPSRARYVFGPGFEFEQLPRVGKCYVQTPDILGAPKRVEVGDELMRVLDVQ
ncbi:MAG: FtsK/SpoIIIE domain-containing protein [Parafannyhessea umbonata]|uniref:FtsK/SpoIIIE domain-containing protein n=1 Tax=Parafannyhessea umbonata TaxID=604330 RepID=UPI0026EBFC59|nr:FtsK/SpoIIIE domain-containing protein [Parafannyhessea umbonata]MDD6567005.1 FtsK/SpoIIIE domain-containing protein [Parafannyhessea umbonata]